MNSLLDICCEKIFCRLWDLIPQPFAFLLRHFYLSDQSLCPYWYPLLNGTQQRSSKPLLQLPAMLPRALMSHRVNVQRLHLLPQPLATECLRKYDPQLGRLKCLIPSPFCILLFSQNIWGVAFCRWTQPSWVRILALLSL